MVSEIKRYHIDFTLKVECMQRHIKWEQRKRFIGMNVTYNFAKSLAKNE